MIIGPTLISFLLPLQLHLHKMSEWKPQVHAFVHIVCDSAWLIGLPNLMNAKPITNNNQELLLREKTNFDKLPKRRRLFIINSISNMSIFSNE